MNQEPVCKNFYAPHANIFNGAEVFESFRPGRSGRREISVARGPRATARGAIRDDRDRK